MLTRLLRTQLRPYKRTLLIVVALQAVQTTAALALPALNAHIIDDGIVRIANGRPRAAIPNDDRTGAILTGGNCSFEVTIVNRMVFDFNGQASIFWNHAGAFRHGPTG